MRGRRGGAALMAGPDATAAVRAILWPAASRAETTYAVLGGARDKRIEQLLGLWGLEHASLYGDDTGSALRNASPFLVALDREREETELLLDRAWGRAWGVFAVVPTGTGFAAMQRHCRRLLRVLGPNNAVMLFRYYDPRVLRVFLPTSEGAQRTELFGPVDRWVLEDAAAAPLVARLAVPA